MHTGIIWWPLLWQNGIRNYQDVVDIFTKVCGIKREQTNLFFDDKNKNGMSELMEHYIAGQLACLPEILPMFAPTVNSYKRIGHGDWAPSNVTWGIDNRTAAVRVIQGKNEIDKH